MMMLKAFTAQATQEVMERLLTSLAREGLVITEAVKGGSMFHGPAESVFVPVRRHYSMARFDLSDLPRRGGSAGSRVSSLSALFEFLLPSVPIDVRERLLLELENGLANTEQSLDALAQLGPGEPGQGSLADWEGRVWLGHPLHPGARLRSGVSAQDNERYGPEWQARLRLPLLEIPREDLTVSGDYWTFMADLFPEVAQLSEGDRVVVPVHPWAAENDLPRRFAAHFESRRWHFTEEHLQARPSMSFRSVILDTQSGPSSDGTLREPHFKLPVAVQTTGATRTVSVAATHNGPLMSGFLHELWQQPAVRKVGVLDRLHLMEEPASFRLADNSGDGARFLSGILRLGPGASMDGERWLLPAAALLEPRENPLFVRAASYYRTSPQTLWREYCQRLLPPQAYLCGRLGVALEAHPQNVVVDFRGPAGQMPEIHFHYRDLGGIRLHPVILGEALKALDLDTVLEVPQFWPGSATSTDSARDLASKFVYSLLQNHLGELSRAIVRATGESEAPYWESVRTTLERHRGLLGEDLAQRVFTSDWDLKAMWRMRIDSAITEYSYSPVKNPLETTLRDV